MKKVFCLAFLFFGNYFYGQSTYCFDYLIEYQSIKPGDSIVKTLYLLTNSKDNTYYVSLSSENENTFNFNFNHDAFRSFSLTDRKPFFQAKTIKIPCETVHLQKDEINLKRYDFNVYSDTLIEEKSYKYYTMQYRKESDEKRYKNGKSYYIIQNETEFHKPLKIFSSAFDVALTSETFPNGIAREIYNTGKNGLRFRFKLVSYTKVDRTIVIPNCAKIIQ